MAFTIFALCMTDLAEAAERLQVHLAEQLKLHTGSCCATEAAPPSIEQCAGLAQHWRDVAHRGKRPRGSRSNGGCCPCLYTHPRTSSWDLPSRAVAESQLQAIQSAVFFYLPSMLLSGFMFPFDGMPKWARAVGEALPLTHFVRATRCVFFRGQCGSLVLSEMMPGAVFALIASGFALLAYRRRID